MSVAGDARATEPAPEPEPRGDVAAEEQIAASRGSETAPDLGLEVFVSNAKPAPSRGAADHRITVGELAGVPRKSAAELLRLAPSIFLLKDGGGEGHADRIYLRGFDAREGQDLELTIDGVPINQSGSYHGAGFADLNFLIPELVWSIRVLEGPYDPRQGNFAVAGSADYEAGLERRGLGARVTYGSFDTVRVLGLWGPEGESPRTFVGAEVYRTSGFGQNREAWRARAHGQYETKLGERTQLRVHALGYATEYLSAGVLREDDVAAGRVGFYDTNDPRQGGGAMRFQGGLDLRSRGQDSQYGLSSFLIFDSTRIRENFTGFVLDEQLGRQTPHGQRGDLLDLATTSGTFGLRGFGRKSFEVLGLDQEVELGLYGRGDLADNVQQRIGAASGDPYLTEASLAAKLANVALYGDLALRLQPWWVIRGGARVDLFAFDVDDHCAVKDVSRPNAANPPGDASCLSQQRFGDHREPNQRSSTAALLPLPRISSTWGPFSGITLSLAYGRGARSVDPSYITDRVETPFARADSWDLGAAYAKTFESFRLTVASSFFVTKVDRDQIFNQTEGRNTLADGTTRAGWSATARGTGSFLDVSANASLVRSRFDDPGLLVPYVPDVVLRTDAATFGDLFDLVGSPVRGRVSLGASFVGPRALPYGQRSDAIFLLDAAVSAGWRFLDLEIAGTNLVNLDVKQAEFNYVSDFSPGNPANLVAARHFAAGAPLGVFGTLSGTLGEEP